MIGRPSAEELEQTRQWVRDHPGACVDGAFFFAELDAVTRERDELKELIPKREERHRVELDFARAERDEARKELADTISGIVTGRSAAND